MALEKSLKVLRGVDIEVDVDVVLTGSLKTYRVRVQRKSL